MRLAQISAIFSSISRIKSSKCRCPNQYHKNKHTLNKSNLKRTNPSAERNQRPILEILLSVLDKRQQNIKLLEIASGTGQHSAYFANYFPNITFQPSEYDKTLISSIQEYANDSPNRNMADPVYLDISNECEQWEVNFPLETFDYMLNINMIHISPIKCTEGLFRNANKLLKPKGLLITYGPYAVNGQLTPESNVKFNEMLKGQNPAWGVRDLRDLKAIAKSYGIMYKKSFDMPANNKTIIWEKPENEMMF